MKRSEELKDIRGKMRNGGFLGDDARDLADIISDDENTVEAIGLSNSDIAKRMMYFTEAAGKVFGNVIKIDDDYLVSVDEHRGSVQCPFEDGFKAGKRNTRLENIRLKKKVFWSDLNIHMIEAHGFYEGKGSMFRIEAAMAAEILGLVK